MLKTMEIVAQAMNADMQRLANISQNVANAQTPGYKRQVGVQKPFASEMDLAAAGMNSSATDISAGSLRATSNPLDLAIEGQGFFVFDTPQGIALSRRAGLHADAQGRLVNDAGLAVQGERGELRATGPISELRIDRQGEVWAGDRSLGKLMLLRPGNPATLGALGGGLYRTARGDTTQAASDASVVSGYQESSNVNATSEMVRLMETSRHFEAMSRVAQGYDDVMDKALRKLGDL